MGHHHKVSGKSLLITIILNVIITIAQIIGGILSGSLALLSDAMHNFSDVLSLVIAYGANRLSHRSSSKDKTLCSNKVLTSLILRNRSLLSSSLSFLIPIVGLISLRSFSLIL